MQRIHESIRTSNRRTFGAIVGGSLVISAALLLGLDGYSLAMVEGAPVLTWLLGFTGVLVLIAHWPGRDV